MNETYRDDGDYGTGCVISKLPEEIEDSLTGPMGPVFDDLIRAEANNLPFYLLIDTIGGNYHTAKALFDLIKGVSIPTTTVLLGKSESAASLIFLSAQTRIAFPGAYMMFHDMEFSNGGDSKSYRSRFEFHTALSVEYHNLLKFLLGKELADVISGQQYFMKPAEMLERGLINEISTSFIPKRPGTND